MKMISLKEGAAEPKDYVQAVDIRSKEQYPQRNPSDSETKEISVVSNKLLLAEEIKIECGGCAECFCKTNGINPVSSDSLRSLVVKLEDIGPKLPEEIKEEIKEEHYDLYDDTSDLNITQYMEDENEAGLCGTPGDTSTAKYLNPQCDNNSNQVKDGLPNEKTDPKRLLKKMIPVMIREDVKQIENDVDNRNNEQELRQTLSSPKKRNTLGQIKSFEGNCILDSKNNSSLHETPCPTDERPAKKSTGKTILESLHCSLCKYETKNIRRLRVHMRVHKKVVADIERTKAEQKRRILNCESCNYTTHVRYNLNKHMRFHHGKKYARRQDCKFCSKTYSTQQCLDEHVVSRHSNKMENLEEIIQKKILSCKYCSFKSLYNGRFTSHIAINHTFMCHLCDYKSHFRKSLVAHIRKHRPVQNRFKCLRCLKKFRTQWRLDSHILFFHNKDRDLLQSISSPVRECPKCPFRCIFAHHFGQHVKQKHTLVICVADFQSGAVVFNQKCATWLSSENKLIV